jgi:cation diffusion facilitator family transporter
MSSLPDARAEADREKRQVAFVSVVAAVVLTGGKLAVGLWTNSLGILSEAAHSGLDLVAAVITLFAVRFSSRPPDADHAYGHGKVENLSALFETVLLLATCVWITYEAVHRLFFQSNVHVRANAWAFGVVLGSIAIDVWRSRALLRVARKYDSQALEADALHFSTDVWSSTVVLVGLVGVVAGAHWGVPWLGKADAVAALGVSAIVVWVSLRLARRSVADLLDAAPAELPAQVRGAAQVPGVRAVRAVRVRKSGPEVFADVVLEVDAHRALEAAHGIADQAEAAILALLPRADVVVHLEPATDATDVHAVTSRIAARHGASAHGVRVYDQPGGRIMELHLELDPGLRLGEAHDRASAVESSLREALPELSRVITHLEPGGAAVIACTGEAPGAGEIIAYLGALLEQGIGLCDPHDIILQQGAAAPDLSFHCAAPPDQSLAEVHDASDRLELSLRERFPGLGRVTIHVEPPGE